MTYEEVFVDNFFSTEFGGSVLEMSLILMIMIVLVIYGIKKKDKKQFYLAGLLFVLYAVKLFIIPLIFS